MIPNASYANPSVYAKYTSEVCSSCGGLDPSCPCHKEKECSCPPGLVKVVDDNGDCAGCLTPADAEIYNNMNTKCGEGYVKLFDSADRFLGCVTPSELNDYNTANP